MSRYQLSEAYSEIYDYRKIEESFDNLRFVDYLLPEHIEEVIEELVWEFRDYGNTLQESFEMIDYALEDQVICESYDELIADVLYEATVDKDKVSITKGKHRSRFAGSAQDRVTTGKTYRFDPQEVERRAKRLGQVKTANRSVKSRMSKLSGPISSVKQANSGSQGGMGKANKSLGGKIVERGQALLKGLLRRGASALTKTGKRMMASGTRAAAAPATTRTARVGSRRVSVTSEPTAETGSTRRAVGRAIRTVGTALQRRMGKDKKTSTATTSASEPDDTKTPKSNVLKTRYRITPRLKASKNTPFASPGDVVGISKGSDNQKMIKMSPQVQDSDSRAPKGPSKFKSPRSSRTSTVSRPETFTRQSATKKTPEPTPTAPTRATRRSSVGEVSPVRQRRGAPSKTPRVDMAARIARRKAQMAPPKSDKPATASTPKPRSRKSTFKSPEAEARYKEQLSKLKEEHLNEILQLISEDLIEAGYTSNLNESYDLIDQMDESTLYDIIQEYLD
jgi:hypothetical protein